jgi:hypothetical protein
MMRGGAMPYSNTVTLVPMEGGAWPPVTARLWMLWSVVGTGSGTGPVQSEEGTDGFNSAQSFSFSFARDADFSYASRDAGLSLQDTPRITDDSGWWFRSGRFPGPLPAAPLEVVLLSPLTLTRTTDFAAALPPLPIAMSPLRTINFLSVITGSMIVATIGGTTTEGGVPVAFQCRQELTITPSPNLHEPDTELLRLGFPNPALLSFNPLTPGDAAGSVAAAALDALAGALVGGYAAFLRSSILPGFLRALEARYVALALGSLAGSIGPGATTLPAGVIASARSVEVTGDGLIVRGALGAFGGVFSKLPPRPAPSPGRCFIAAAATSPSSPEVSALRAFRDRYLLRSRAGAGMVRLYEAISPPIAERIRRHRALRLAARHLLVKPAALVAKISLFFGGGAGEY